MKLEDVAGAQFEDVKNKLRPIAEQGKIIGLLDGNHENNIRKRHFRHLTLDLCRELGVEYLSYSSFIRLKFSVTNSNGVRGSGKSYIISAAHGRGGGRKKGGQVNSMGDALAWANVDIFLRGHTHRLIADSITRLHVMGNPPTLAQETPVMGITGCYFRTYAEGTDSYGEEADYPPSDLGCIVVGLRPFKVATKDENEKPVRVGEVTISRFIP
jgi:hypothetical protein